jgi:hypothetical protein
MPHAMGAAQQDAQSARDLAERCACEVLMRKITLHNLNLIQIAEEDSRDPYYGGLQQWYSTRWKRLSGCGPTVVTGIVNYLSRARDEDDPGDAPVPKKTFQKLMEDVWKFVTPTVRGIPSTDILRRGALQYIKARDLRIRLDFLDVDEAIDSRPALDRLLAFLRDALENDAPVAFLNLHSGSEEALDSWHWVTVISLEYEPDESAASIEFVDEGRIIKINLKSWYLTTALGGGFVGFYSEP